MANLRPNRGAKSLTAPRKNAGVNKPGRKPKAQKVGKGKKIDKGKGPAPRDPPGPETCPTGAPTAPSLTNVAPPPARAKFHKLM